MKKPIDKRWWFVLPCGVIAVLIVQGLLRAAGLADRVPGSGFSLAALLVWGCCFYAVQQLLTFGLWLLVLRFSPRSIVGRD